MGGEDSDFSDALEGGTASWAGRRGARSPGRGCRGWTLAGGVGILVACALVAALVPSQRETPAHGDISATVGLTGLEFAALLATGIQSASKVYKDMAKDSTNTMKSLTNPLDKIKAAVLKEGTPPPVDMRNLTYTQEIPKQNLQDGNVCPDDEESLGGLCYKKCKDLTKGTHPIRTTAWSCCMEEPCSYFNSKFTNPLLFCGGFDVAGDKEGKSCPHQPGTCLVNEEFSMGYCFKKCAILTNNTFPYRAAASSCCRYQNHYACLDATNLKTSAAFNVGGIQGHGGAPGDGHPPMPELTESVSGSTVEPYVAPAVAALMPARAAA